MNARIPSSRYLSIFGILLALALLSMLPANAYAAATLHDFTVNIDGGPEVAPQVPAVTGVTPPEGCTFVGEGLPPSGVRCTVAVPIEEDALVLKGTATDTASGKSGTISVTCRLDATVSATVLSATTGGAVTFEALSGSGSEACDWAMKIGGDSLTGTLTGTMGMELGDAPNTGVWTGSFRVNVLGGSGGYAGLNGSGNFQQSETISLTTMQRAAMRMAVVRAAADATPDASTMHLSLAAGKPRVKFLNPASGARVKQSSKAKLEVFTAPGAACTFTATRKGYKRRTLGTFKDGTPADGKVASKARFAKGLAKGGWTLQARCTAAKKTGTASVKITVT